jgi:hypothetical protein
MEEQETESEFSQLFQHPPKNLCHTTYSKAAAISKSLQNKQTPWSESASELYRPSDRRMSAK